MLKLTTYIPESHLEVVKSALFAAGAGQYEQYDQCCWQVLGTGQFRPLAGANPSIGTVGELTQLAEWRVEMLVDEWHLDEVITALKQSHPYEQPAFDVVAIRIT